MPRLIDEISKKTIETREWLYNEYIIKNKSLKQIARELGVSLTYVSIRKRRFELKKDTGTLLRIDGKTVTTNKEVRYIDGVAHVECGFLKIFFPISKFHLRKKCEGVYYIDQPSEPGKLEFRHRKYNQKPKNYINKTIDGKLFRFCRELQEYRPIEEFYTYLQYGKTVYRNVCRGGKKIENKRNIKSTRIAIKKWKKNNRHKLAIAANRRVESRKYATPKWLTDEHLNDMKFLYQERDRMMESDGIKYNVHHIYPLHGEDDYGNHVSCGLNVPWNLTIITAEINGKILSKNPEFHSFDVPESIFVGKIYRAKENIKI